MPRCVVVRVKVIIRALVIQESREVHMSALVDVDVGRSSSRAFI